MPENSDSYAFNGVKFNLGTSNPDEKLILESIGINKTKHQNSTSNGNEKSFTTLIFDSNSKLIYIIYIIRVWQLCFFSDFYAFSENIKIMFF